MDSIPIAAECRIHFSAHDNCHFSKSALGPEQKLWGTADVCPEFPSPCKAKGRLKLELLTQENQSPKTEDLVPTMLGVLRP